MTTDPLFDFSGKTVLVTGGSRGLGREMALAFAQRGADAVIVSRRIESCETVAAEIEALGRRAWPIACNVTSWDELEPLVDRAWGEAGRLDILVNNAGSSPLAPSSLETPEDLFDKIVSLNFKAPFRLMALVGSRMAAGDGGTVVNISSTGAIRPHPTIAPYSGAKSALNAITEAFAREYAPKVRVNAIMPGRFLTDISKAWTEETRRNEEVALRRSGEPGEIVTAALYLASDASGFTTGSVIRVDGGAP